MRPDRRASGTSARSARSPVAEPAAKRSMRRSWLRPRARPRRRRRCAASGTGRHSWSDFEQRGARARCTLRTRGQVAIEELVLQRLGARRDDDLATGKQRGNQIRESLPGPGARLGDQHRGALDRIVDRLRHFELLRPPLEAVDRRGERPVGGKGVLQPGVQSSASTLTQTRRDSLARRPLAEAMPR